MNERRVEGKAGGDEAAHLNVAVENDQRLEANRRRSRGGRNR